MGIKKYCTLEKITPGIEKLDEDFFPTEKTVLEKVGKWLTYQKIYFQPLLLDHPYIN